MRRKRRLMAAAIFFAIFFVQGSLTTVFGADALTVSDIRAMVSERGSSVYSLSVLARVTNAGASGNIVIEVIAVNKDGFQVGSAVLSGPVEQGQTRMLSTVIQMQKENFENVDHWEWKKP